ncbi:MAG: bacterial Ig-like domain-containing protein [Eubacteriales bacterium]|nr:bacterial Ig-like domain-containing protein [Eubacteriales bacterium]
MKILSVIMCFSVLLIMTTSYGAATDTAVGDINGDGKVDYDDAYLIFNYVAGSGSLSLSQLEHADINGDGKITVADAAQVFHFVSGCFSALPYTPKGFGRLVVLSYPDKTEYTEGESLDMSGFSLAAAYENGQTEIIENYSYSGYSSTPGVKIVVVSHNDAKTAFTVTVFPADVAGIEITNPPVKLVYTAGQALDLTGMKITAVMADGSRVSVTGYVVSGFESQPGTYTLTVTYRLRKAYFDVTVIPG